MVPAEEKGSAPHRPSSQRWTNALLIIATIAALSGVLALLFRPAADPGVEVTLPTPTPPPKLMVYVSGALAQPGVYVFQQGDRLQDAVTTAGGLLPDADTSAINLATLLQDEQHHRIPFVGEVDAGTSTAPASSSESSASTQTVILVSPSPDAAIPSSTNPLDLNTASLEQLQLLPGIGAVKAHAIVDFRSVHGPFGEISEITSVPGIGPVTLENINHLITVNQPSP